MGTALCGGLLFGLLTWGVVKALVGRVLARWYPERREKEPWRGLWTRHPDLVGTPARREARLSVLMMRIDLALQKAIANKGSQARVDTLQSRWGRTKEAWRAALDALIHKTGGKVECCCASCQARRAWEAVKGGKIGVVMSLASAIQSSAAPQEELKAEAELNALVEKMRKKEFRGQG